MAHIIQSKNPAECKKALKNLRELNTDQLDLIEEFVKNLKSLRKDQ